MYLYVVCMKIWNMGEAEASPIELAATLQGHRDGVRALAVSDTRGLLFSGSDDKMIRVCFGGWPLCVSLLLLLLLLDGLVVWCDTDPHTSNCRRHAATVHCFCEQGLILVIRCVYLRVCGRRCGI